jgi:peptidoglycan/LPS O-acetylase OafA/YrhL
MGDAMAPDEEASTSPSPIAERFRYQPALDGVRGMAILGVMAFHADIPGFPGGGTGVLLFFALSGYLITNLLFAEQEQADGVRLGRFYARRGLRLLPALIVMLVVVGAVASQSSTAVASQTVGFILPALLYIGNWVQAWHTHAVSGVLGHTWSLSVEEQFYLLWPLALGALLKKGVRRRSLMLVALVGAGLSELVRVVVWSDHPTVNTTLRMYGTDTAASSLLVGCALAIALKVWPAQIGHTARVAVWPAVAFLAVVATRAHSAYTSVSAARFYDVVIWPAVDVASVSLIAYLVTNPTRMLAALLSWRPLQYVGRISYGLYLWHIPIFVWLTSVHRFGSRATQWAAQFALTFLAAVASFELVERRFLALKSRFAGSATI